MSQNFSSGVNRMWRLLTSHSFHPWYVPWEKPSQSTWGRRWWKAIPWKNRLSPPEDAVDERLSHGKTGLVHLRTPLMKGYPMEKPEMSWLYFGRTGDVHNFANVSSPVLPLNPSIVFNGGCVLCFIVFNILQISFLLATTTNGELSSVLKITDSDGTQVQSADLTSVSSMTLTARSAADGRIFLEAKLDGQSDVFWRMPPQLEVRKWNDCI